MMTPKQIVDVAVANIQHAEFLSSAKICAEDAGLLLDTDPEASQMWALKSLKYSLGIFHPTYREVEAAIDYNMTLLEKPQ